MTIHSSDPFEVPSEQKSAARRWRSRLSQTVGIAATGGGANRVGLTISSFVVVEGVEDRLVLWADPDSDLGERLRPGVRTALSVLQAGDGQLGEAFAGLAPAPGGPFRQGEWEQTEHGPVLTDHAWAGGTVAEVREMGWSLECTVLLEEFNLVDTEPLVHRRGRYW